MKNRFRIYFRLFIVLAVAVAAGFVSMPNGPYLKIGDRVIFQKEMRVKQGLDLQGGARLTYLADLSAIENDRKEDAMGSLANVIENRVNAFGVTEPIVQVVKSGDEDRLVVDMPGVKDVSEANKLIGETAELDFRELSEDGSAFNETGLTGKEFRRADVSFDQTGNPQIDIEFSGDGGKKFEEITERNIGKPLAIFLDGTPISEPVVNQKISGGRGVITGKFDIKEAKNLAIQLNAGALPVPVKLIETRSVGATLGRDSIENSLYAGALSIVFIIFFMIFAYRMMGFFSATGLVFYFLLVLALVKIFGITLTMGGIAGLILSIGVSIDSDILVFERIREELRSGKSFEVSVRRGFRGAWLPIRDSNTVSVIIASLLYTAGGTIRGFAVVLAIGILVGLVTTFVGTRAFLEVSLRFRPLKNYFLYVINKKEVAVS